MCERVLYNSNVCSDVCGRALREHFNDVTSETYLHGLLEKTHLDMTSEKRYINIPILILNLDIKHFVFLQFQSFIVLSSM